MQYCKYCKCSDFHACKGGCFWVNKEKTICSSCAVVNKIVFKNNVSGAHAIIIDAIYDPYGMTAEVKIMYDDEKIFNISLFDFMYHYTEVTS